MIISKWLWGGAATAAAYINDWQAQFTSGSSQLLKMTDANFGAFDRAKFTISRFVTFDSLGATQILFRQGLTSGNYSSILYLNSANQIVWSGSSNGVSFDSSLITAATHTTGTEYHIQFDYDSANGTTADRQRLYVNGVRITAFDTETHSATAVYDSAHDIETGGATGKSQYLNGKQDECAFFSGSNPSVGDLRDSGTGAAKDLTGLTDLWSWLTFETDVTTDEVLATAWTNNNTVTRVAR